MNICIKCKHHTLVDSGFTDVHRCEVSPREAAIDPVTGDGMYLLTGSGSTIPELRIYTKERLKECLVVNANGTCGLYEEK